MHLYPCVYLYFYAAVLCTLITKYIVILKFLKFSFSHAIYPYVVHNATLRTYLLDTLMNINDIIIVYEFSMSIKFRIGYYLHIASTTAIHKNNQYLAQILYYYTCYVIANVTCYFTERRCFFIFITEKEKC